MMATTTTKKQLQEKLRRVERLIQDLRLSADHAHVKLQEEDAKIDDPIKVRLIDRWLYHSLHASRIEQALDLSQIEPLYMTAEKGGQLEFAIDVHNNTE